MTDVEIPDSKDESDDEFTLTEDEVDDETADKTQYVIDNFAIHAVENKTKL